MYAGYITAFLITLGVPTETMIGRTHIMKRNEYSAITDLCGLARTRNLAVWMEHPTAECGTATGGSRPTAANGKFPRRSEDTKLPPFMVAVVHSIMIMAENDEPLYRYAQSKRVKSHSVAWMALLKDIAMTLQWHDDVPHAENLTSEQVKNWFKFKGQDYKTELAPLVKLIDEWRAYMFKDESKKSESLVTDMTQAIQQNQPKVLLSDDAVDYFDDYDAMLDEFEGAYQTIIHIENKHGGEEMWFIYEPGDNIIAIGDFDVDRADAERAKELMEKFVRGELEQKPGNDEYLGGLDYIAIVDGNTYTSTAFIEGR